MLLALPVLLLVCLPSICGNDVNATDRNTDLNNTHFVTSANRPLSQRNQTKITRDDQLLSLLAARRRQIIQNRFKNHIQNIVEISNGNNISTIPKNIALPNNTKTLNVHLNLSDLLKNPGSSNSDERTNLSNSSTESNLVNVSSPRTTYKPVRKNVDTPEVPENKNSKQSNMPIIRNILYRRKMGFLNRKLPLDFEQIAFDTLGISEVNKNPEDLIFDNEDSLQVEESSHDKLIYYDVKNNASKKSNNNFEDSSDEMKSMSMNNKTFHNNNNNKKNINTTTTQPETKNIKNETNLDDIVVIFNNTESTTEQIKINTTEIPNKINKTEIKTPTKNTTRFMSPSLYNYFRPLDVPEEEMQPFLRFGDKISTIRQNQSTKPITIEKKKQLLDETNIKSKTEEEIDENMDVLAEKPILFENKITKVNLPNQKVIAARDYYKNRQNKINKNITEVVTPPKQIKNIAQFRNVTRNRGFRNQTIFFQNKRSGVRQTINLRGNTSLADLKPSTIVTTIDSITTETIIPIAKPTIRATSTTILPALNLNTTENKSKLQLNPIKSSENTTEIITTSTTPEINTFSIVTTIKGKIEKIPKLTFTTTQKPEISTKGHSSTTTKISTIIPDLKTSSTTYKIPDSTTITIPTTRILSTAVVTSVSIESSKSKQNKTDNIPIKTEVAQTTTDINDSDATVVAALSNFTSQAFQNKSRNHNITSTRNPATVYPNINLEISTRNSSNSYLTHSLEQPVLKSNSGNKTKFILRPTKRVTTTTIQPDINTSTDFIIHVAEVELSTETIIDTTTIKIDTTKPEITTKKLEPNVEVKISSRINFDPNDIKTHTIMSTENTTPKLIKQTTVLPTTEEEITTKAPNSNRTFNTTMLTNSEAESELPLATLFSVTEFKKPDLLQNGTKFNKPVGVETVISRKSDNEVSIDNIHAAYILAALGFIPMMVIVIYVIRSVVKRKHKIVEDFEAEMHHDSEKKSIIHPVARLPTLVLDPSNKWEFPRAKLRLQTLLGQGNFGQVWKAEADDLKGHVGLTRLVAVKTIKDGAGTKERDDLLKELAIMQKMGSHPNVVTLLGCCTDKEPYLLIMEYVMYGKLLTFLRDHRTRRDYYNFSDDAATLTARDLTVFAYCVARGMEYLSSKGIIHRDLAARNILVDHNKLCKIADFGMSRDVGPSGEITEPRQPRNALPVRWMAIESLMYSVFSYKTDVWAFGVLLWEIVTLGSSPYANMSGREVMRLVCDGYRLERPSHCRPELYRVMARAWLADPSQRPSFTELRTDLAAMLEAAPAEGSYVDLESFRADSTVYEIDNCTPRGNYFTVKSRFSEFECDI